MSFFLLKKVVLRKEFEIFSKFISVKSLIKQEFLLKGVLGFLNFVVVQKSGDIYFKKSDLFSLLNNFFSYIKGISFGFFSRLLLVGVGFKGWCFKNFLLLDLGYGNFFLYLLPEGVIASVKKNTILLFSFSNLLVSSVSTDLQRLRIPDKYKGKGVRTFGLLFNLKKKKKMENNYIVFFEKKYDKKLTFYHMLADTFGFGYLTIMHICGFCGVNPYSSLNVFDNFLELELYLFKHFIFGRKLKKHYFFGINEKKKMNTYCGLRHNQKLPTRGQRTHSNAKTVKRVNFVV